jgi:hypothetical protein
VILKRSSLIVFAALFLSVTISLEYRAAALNNMALTPWYDPDDVGCGGDTGGTSDEPKADGDKIKAAYEYFVWKGLKDFQAAGIVGNLIQESGVDPRSNQEGGGVGRGIAQWSAGGRWDTDKGDNLVEFAAGRDIYDMRTQLDFLWHEMSNIAPWKDTMPAVTASTNIDPNDNSMNNAVVAFEEKFEKAGTPNMPRRIEQANITLGRAKDGHWKGSNVSDDCGNSGGNVSTDGYAFPLADQKQHSYSTLPCEKQTCHHDGTAAFDLIWGTPEEMGGRAVYAITDGEIEGQATYHVNGCFEIQFKSDKTYQDKPGKNYYYWYGHLQNPVYSNSEAEGKRFKAGDKIAEVADLSKTSACWSGTTHLHIDRGCIQNGIPQQGGSVGCRDPEFVPLMNKIWEGLPK